MREELLVVALLASALAGCIGTVDSPNPAEEGEIAPTPIPRSVEGLPDSQPPERVDLADGDTFELSAGYVKHDPGTGEPIRMMAYNGQIPGPELHVDRDATVDVTFTNELDRPTTVHWHGLRLDNAFDGVPNLTQQPVQPGETFEYTIETPDAGVFWYHPHVRTDVQKELGLYGALIVEPPREDTERYPDETVVHLDDLRLEGGDVPAMYEEVVTFADPGRWGNHPFVDGDETTELAVGPQERHRLHLINPANARTWRLDFQGFEEVEKISAGASYLEEPREIDELVLGPAERATVDVRVEAGSSGRIVDQATTWTLLRAAASVDAAEPGDALTAERAPAGPHERARAEDRQGFLEEEPDERVHLRMVRNETVDPNASAEDDGHGNHDHGAPEPSAGEVDPMPSSETLSWELVDVATGETQPTYDFEVGDVVEFQVDIVHQHGGGGDHAAHAPVPHTIHLHGQRFLVEDHGGDEPEDRVWRDTMRANDPVRAYQSTTIQVEMSNPGTWLLHCHISEHGEVGMTALVTVTEPG